MFASIIVGTAVFAIAVVMSMVGRGGGNFYVPILVASGMVMGQAAGTAAALSIEANVAPRKVDIAKLQNTLKRDKAVLS